MQSLPFVSEYILWNWDTRLPSNEQRFSHLFNAQSHPCWVSVRHLYVPITHETHIKHHSIFLNVSLKYCYLFIVLFDSWCCCCVFLRQSEIFHQLPSNASPILALRGTEAVDFHIIRGVLPVPAANSKLWIATVESLHDKCGLSLIKNILWIYWKPLLALVWVLYVRNEKSTGLK